MMTEQGDHDRIGVTMTELGDDDIVGDGDRTGGR